MKLNVQLTYYMLLVYLKPVIFYFILQYGTNPSVHEYNSIIIIVLIVYGNVAQYQRESNAADNSTTIINATTVKNRWYIISSS